MGQEYIIGGAQGFNPDVDSAYQLTDADENVYKVKAKEDVGLELLRNGVRTQPYNRVEAKTADYTVVVADHGAVFTTEGASGNVNFTLPATADLPTGWECTFFNAADFNMTVTAGTADTMVTFNDVAADSIAFSTTSEKVGGGVKIIKGASKIFALVMLGAETQTPTIATA